MLLFYHVRSTRRTTLPDKKLLSTIQNVKNGHGLPTPILQHAIHSPNSLAVCVCWHLHKLLLYWVQAFCSFVLTSLARGWSISYGSSITELDCQWILCIWLQFSLTISTKRIRLVIVQFQSSFHTKIRIEQPQSLLARHVHHNTGLKEEPFLKCYNNQ